MLDWLWPSVDEVHHITELIQVHATGTSVPERLASQRVSGILLFAGRSFTLFKWGRWSTFLIFSVQLVELLLLLVDLVHQGRIVEHVVDLAAFAADLDTGSDLHLW